ncbi:MAG: sporulation transcription factor Spo0A [Clostridiaceae bacterium]|jgi:two-component system response regulator (stage 0 sporulation protein A)|nr:sporulation transcription factor Spo0A [Clostridiaceae bacterium]
MSKKTIIIADDNSELVTTIKKFFENDEDFMVMATAQNGLDAVDLIEKHCPDFVLLDIVMPELDGFGVLTQLNYDAMPKRPTIIMMSQLTADGFVNKAIRLGAAYFLAKPFGNMTLRECISDFAQSETALKPMRAVTNEYATRRYPYPARPMARSLDEKIANIFISVGIPAHIKGYPFLREAIKMAVENPEMINAITKRLYPSIAERFSTSASKVERAIRHAIEVAWNRGKIENINAIFGINVYSAKEKPTNGEFIALIADKMLLEGA